MTRKIIHCAIYTRKSSEEGLEQDFNSLDAQREAGEAYIKSQKHEGWEMIPTKYNDGGYSGGNMDRPALKSVLADIEAGKIDIVVVYKVDRLSRALSDFAKMVEVFDKHNVSFVSVTQAFNTTTSMGRLTLNVLLSFAQFEREVTGERIRDKFAASKKKGIFMGGPLPIGYDVKDRKLLINEPEAEIVRYIYKRYLERAKHETLPQLLRELKSKGYKNKSWISKKGNQVTGKEFDLKQLHRILSNPIYCGKIRHKDKIYEGEHESIIHQDIWDQVQEKITKHIYVRNKDAQSERSKLHGKVWDYHGNKMTATYSYKYGKAGRYKMKYYQNQEIYRRGETASEFKRIRSYHLDDLVTEHLIELITTLIKGISLSNDQDLSVKLLKRLQYLKVEPENFVSKVILYPQHLELTLSLDANGDILQPESILKLRGILNEQYEISSDKENILSIQAAVPITYRKLGGRLHIIKDGESTEADIDKQSYYPDDKTFIFIAKGFYWSKLIRQGVHKSSREIAAAHNHSVEYVKRALRQRYLSPQLIKYITNNEKNSKQIGVDHLINLNNWCWEKH